jgi:hypothetical protein
MSENSRNLIVLAALAAGLLSATAVSAQTYAQPAPLYPYALQADQPYAVEVAPNTYMIQRPAHTRAYPYVGCTNGCGRQAGTRTAKRVERVAPAGDRLRKPVDRARIEELRARHQSKRNVINTQKIVREPPVVVETKRYVDDPPRVIERYRVVEEAPSGQAARGERDAGRRASGTDKTPRVIQAEAEVTIVGPDRMSIRLFRKGQRPTANARAD